MLKNHHCLPIAAEDYYWKAAGYSITEGADVYSHSDRLTMDRLLAIGMQETGSQDHRAVIWAAKERDRRLEERTRVTAQSKAAQSLHELAVALQKVYADGGLKEILKQVNETADPLAGLHIHPGFALPENTNTSSSC